MRPTRATASAHRARPPGPGAAGSTTRRRRRPARRRERTGNSCVWADGRGCSSPSGSGRTYGPISSLTPARRATSTRPARCRSRRCTSCPTPRGAGGARRPGRAAGFAHRSPGARRLRADRRGRTGPGAAGWRGWWCPCWGGGRDACAGQPGAGLDLRLVAHVPGAVTARSGAPFGVEDRAFEVSHSSPTAPQQWLPDFPMRGWVAAASARRRAAWPCWRAGCTRRRCGGSPTASNWRPTLLRGVGCLSRARPGATRPGDAGPAIATPDAQCLGPQHWDLALLPFAPATLDAVPARAEEFLRPPAAFPVQWSAGTRPAAPTLFTGDAGWWSARSSLPTSGPGAMLHAHNPTPGARRPPCPAPAPAWTRPPPPGDGTLGPFVIAAWKHRIAEQVSMATHVTHPALIRLVLRPGGSATTTRTSGTGHRGRSGGTT